MYGPKVSHVIFECRVINHHPLIKLNHKIICERCSFIKACFKAWVIFIFRLTSFMGFILQIDLYK